MAGSSAGAGMYGMGGWWGHVWEDNEEDKEEEEEEENEEEEEDYNNEVSTIDHRFLFSWYSSSPSSSSFARGRLLTSSPVAWTEVDEGLVAARRGEGRVRIVALASRAGAILSKKEGEMPLNWDEPRTWVAVLQEGDRSPGGGHGVWGVGSVMVWLRWGVESIMEKIITGIIQIMHLMGLSS